MAVCRRWIILIAAATLLMRFAAPVGAAESQVASPPPSVSSATGSPTAAPSGDLSQFKAEMAAALGPIMPMLEKLAASSGTSVAAQGEVEAQHVHPPESKPEVLILLKWLQGQLPTVTPLFSKLWADANPVPAEHYEPVLDWARVQAPVVLPILFKIVCAVGEGLPVEDHVLAPWMCNLLINTLPGLVQSFWSVIVAFAPTVLGLIGKFLPAILEFLINRLSAPAAAAVSVASDVMAAHIHPDVTLPLVGELTGWLAGQLPTIVPLLLPILGDQASVLDKLIADALAITAWLAGQLGTITPPIVRLACIIADDIIPPLLCSVITLFMPIVSGFINKILGIVNAWIKNLPKWTPASSTTTTIAGVTTTTIAGATTTTTPPSTTTTKKCFLIIFCTSAAGAGGAGAAGGVTAADVQSLAMQPVAMNGTDELPETGSPLSFEFVAAGLFAAAALLRLLRRRTATVSG